MDSGKKFSLSMLIDVRADIEQRVENISAAKKRFGADLISELMEIPQPVVIEIKEDYEGEDDNPLSPYEKYPLHFRYTISAIVNSVQHKHIVIGVPEYVSKKLSFFEKLKWLFS